MTMTIGKLKNLFPDHVDEIDELQDKTACGCSGCTWLRLKEKHPELELPEGMEYAAWG